ncbi:MAG: glycosyltransferase, partial [Saprospiraceae bacterium]
LPSYREAIPRVIQEGMSMGKPAITTNVPGCREAVQHGENGFLVNVKDADDLAEKMLKIAEMTNGEREIMGQKGLEKVHAEFDERIIANQILKLIEKSIY